MTGVVFSFYQVGELSSPGGQEAQQGGCSSAAAGSFDLLTNSDLVNIFILQVKQVHAIKKQHHFSAQWRLCEEPGHEDSLLFSSHQLLFYRCLSDVLESAAVFLKHVFVSENAKSQTSDIYSSLGP